MSYATGTTHYNLPQTVGSDKRDWTDTNQAFSDLDTAVYGAAQGAEAATSAIQTINSELDVIAGKQATDEENITTLNGKVSTLEGTTSTLGAEVLDVRQDLQDNIESKHEASATSTHAYAIGDTFYYNDILYKATAAIAIGDTIVPTVNCMGITVMSQVSAIKGDLTASDGLGFEFMTDGDGNYGYRGADDSFVPFSHGGGVSGEVVSFNGGGSISGCNFVVYRGIDNTIETSQTFPWTNGKIYSDGTDFNSNYVESIECIGVGNSYFLTLKVPCRTQTAGYTDVTEPRNFRTITPANTKLYSGYDSFVHIEALI